MSDTTFVETTFFCTNSSFSLGKLRKKKYWKKQVI